MSAFARSLRRLDADSSRATTVASVLALAFLGAWIGWAALARVTLHATSRARVESADAITPVQSPMLGKVSSASLELGRAVRVGDSLVQLDASAERFAAEEQRARRRAVTTEAAALRLQLAAETAADAQERATFAAAIDEAEAALGQADASAEFAAAQAERARSLHTRGMMSEEDGARTQAEAAQAKFAAARARAALRRTEQEHRTRASERTARLRGVDAEIGRLDGEAETIAAAIARLENEIERRIVRAPIAGRLAEAIPLRAGAVLEAGEHVATLVPAGPLRIVADFSPTDALGRILPGQRARLRLDGFPSAEFGALRASVTRVASEIRAGVVRVELALDADSRSRIPLQHALPGVVEIELERTSPLALVLRAAGQLATRAAAQK